MGPQHESCGKHERGSGGKNEGCLQWGRNMRVAESRGIIAASCFSATFNGAAT